MHLGTSFSRCKESGSVLLDGAYCCKPKAGVISHPLRKVIKLWGPYPTAAQRRGTSGVRSQSLFIRSYSACMMVKLRRFALVRQPCMQPCHQWLSLRFHLLRPHTPVDTHTHMHTPHHPSELLHNTRFQILKLLMLYALLSLAGQSIIRDVTLRTTGEPRL